MPDPSARPPEKSVDALIAALRPWLILALVCGGFSLHPGFRETFWTRDYLPNILQQAGTNIILAVGMTFVILTGGIDLSVGSVMALCGVALGLSAKGGLPPFLGAAIAFPFGILVGVWAGKPFFQHGRWIAGWIVSGLAACLLTGLGGGLIYRVFSAGVSLPMALIACLLAGTACGLANGLIVAVGRVPSFVVTLGMLTAARGLTVYATEGNSVSGLPSALGTLGQGAPLVFIALCVVGAGVLLQARTTPGRYLQALGANEEAVRLTGVNVPLYKTLAYVLSGFASAVAAIVLTAKFQLADTGAGMGAELNAIAAVVIGGTSLSGGKGSVLGSLVGALTIAVLNAGLVLVGVKDTLQGVIIGAVIVLAVMVDQVRKFR